ncbi:spore germination protein [Anaerobacillus sp. MEB173]|uniref:spore germination protein n=1 Tax=Anaerobacillus sp. MEB173 TaxID=3383345 RepID=UPI003F8FD14C
MSKNTKEKQPVSKNIHQNEDYLTKQLGIGKSFDVGIRKINILGKELQIYFVNGLCDTAFIIELMKELMELDRHEKKQIIPRKAIENRLTHQQVEYAEDLDQAIIQLLSGLIILLIEDESEAIIIDVRSYPGRGPNEPDTEKVVRGARDGYTENIIENTGLTRRRIRDERLRHEILQVGERSKTDICIAYLEDVADDAMVKVIRKEIENIKIDGLTMADKVVEEFIVKQGMNPFPLVRYSERPDVVATHILEGHVVVFVDGSPSAIITPTTFFHHVQHAEEFRQAPAVGTFFRWVRYSGMIFSLIILPLWYLMVVQPDMLPAALEYIGPNETKNVPVFVQILLAEFGIELLRMAAIHTPSPLATALGLVAALLIGDIAISVGLFIPEVILYVAVGAIGTFATPSYELGVAMKIVRLILIVMTAIFKAPGFIITLTIFVLWLASIRSLEKPYFWPFLPFNPKAAMQIIVRTSVPTMKKRPSIVGTKNNTKQPV